MPCNIRYNILSTGSHGNAVILNDQVMVDCGVPFKRIKPFYQKISLVLLTHIHADHFNKITVRILEKERPALRFACCKWLVKDVAECGVDKRNIDMLKPDREYRYGICNVIPIRLVHNVPNCGYKIHFPVGKVIYATDTNNLNGITAKDYDLYLIEANYEDEAIQEKIRIKKAAGEYAYETQVVKNHLSKSKCDDFIYKNIGTGGTYVYMHCHQEKATESEVK